MPFWSVRRPMLATVRRGARGGDVGQAGEGVGQEADVVEAVARPPVGVLLGEDEPVVDVPVVVLDPAVAVARAGVVVGLVAHPDDPQPGGVGLPDPLHRPDLGDDDDRAGPGGGEELREPRDRPPLPLGPGRLPAPGGDTEAVPDAPGRPGGRRVGRVEGGDGVTGLGGQGHLPVGGVDADDVDAVALLGEEAGGLVRPGGDTAEFVGAVGDEEDVAAHRSAPRSWWSADHGRPPCRENTAATTWRAASPRS